MRYILFLLLALVPFNANAETVWFRGLFGMAFSTGIIDLADYYSEKHYCWCEREKVAKEIILRYRHGKLKGPVNIVGHSLGANATMSLAYDLRKAGVPVGKVVMLDATVVKDMSRFDAHNFMSRDFRAKKIPGAKETYYPHLGHVPLVKDAIVQFRVKRLIDVVS